MTSTPGIVHLSPQPEPALDTSLNVANAWQRLLRQNLLYATPARMPLAAANADAFGGASSACASLFDASMADASMADAPETMPMLYRSEAFAEDLCESHPQFIG